MRAGRLAIVALVCWLPHHAAAAEKLASLPRVAIVANTVPLAEWAAIAMRDGSPHAGNEIREGLRRLGWIDGKNIELIWLSAEGRPDRLPGIFGGLVVQQVDVIVAVGPGSVAAAQATRTIPIVMAASAGAVGSGIASSLGRPGRNVTGVAFEIPPGLIGKRLALLKQAAPAITRVALLMETTGKPGISDDALVAAAAVGVSVVAIPFDDPARLDEALAQVVKERANALLIGDGVWVHRYAVQATINQWAAKQGVPTIHSAAGGAATGGLMEYAIDTTAQYRRIPYFVDRILRGAKPEDLPIEQPVAIELVINRAVAGKLGLQLDPALAVLANRVIP